jgi:hypothetical protein
MAGGGGLYIARALFLALIFRQDSGELRPLAWEEQD